VWWGYPYWTGAYASPAFAYGSPVDTYQASPTGPDAYETALPQENYWYYCQDSQAYYPYVKECPSGWLTVAPSIPSATDDD
jgi:hypothetical protein